MKVLLLSGLFYLMAGMPGNTDCDNIRLDLNIIHTTENKTNGKIEVEIVNGLAPYEFYLFGSGTNNNKIKVKKSELKDLAAGEYLLVVQDKTSCRVTKKIVIR